MEQVSESNMSSVLVLCRVASAASAPKWLSQLNASFADIRYSTYGDRPESEAHYFRGGKWAGIYDFFRLHPEHLTRYDYFWFPDDDIETDAQTALSFLLLCINEGFELAQPALMPESYFAYRETLQSPRFRFRRTNFVELMMPLMTRDFLGKILPLFEGKHAALGLDWMWHRIADDPRKNVAIVDAHAMLHGRPRNSNLVLKMKDQNVDLAEERAATIARHNIEPIAPLTYEGRLTNGLDTSNRLRLALEMLRGYLTVRGRVVNGNWTDRQMLRLIVRQLRS